MNSKTKLSNVSLCTRYLFILLLNLSCAAKLGMSRHDNEDDVDFMLRGPIHEAFADTGEDSGAPEIVHRQVPNPIEEIAPDHRPSGDYVAWIPGYWFWDSDQDDFIWISGVWRDIPRGCQWIPGYWVSDHRGSQYISGFWAAIDQYETTYLPAPPAPLETGPSYPASNNQQWVPGNWVWSQYRYLWQSGYWTEDRPDLVWIPAHYVWCPRGYVFVRGYWDYELQNRGVMFAPIHYRQPVYTTRHYSYTPTIVLEFDVVFSSLFIFSHSHHYYFGDYYGERYENRGFRPWYWAHATRNGFDPNYRSYRRIRLKQNANWENNFQRDYQYRRNHENARPAHTYAHQMTRHDSERNVVNKPALMGRRYSDVVENERQPHKFLPLKANHQKEIRSREQKLRALVDQRRNVETKQPSKSKDRQPVAITQPERQKRKASPIKAKPREKPKDPPKRQSNPKKDPPKRADKKDGSGHGPRPT